VTAPKPNAALAYRALDTAALHGGVRMAFWASRLDDDVAAPVSLDDLTHPACGSTACLAGWATVLSGYQINQMGDVLDEAGDLVNDEIFEFAARLLGMPPPPFVGVEQLSPAARGFYAENRRVANGKAKRVLGWAPRYPDYRTGLRALSAMTRPRSVSTPPAAASGVQR